MITRWSHSALMTYKECPFRAKLKYIEKIKEPEIPPDDPRNRGIRVHSELEHYLLDGAPLPKEARSLEENYEGLRDLAPQCEVPKYFNDVWKPCDESDKWLTVIQDVEAKFEGEHGDTIVLSVDHKTGKRYGNEMKHMAQKITYAVANWCSDPDAALYVSEMWYVDQGDIWSSSFRADDLERKRADLDREVSKMMNDKLFRPRPSAQNCKYCPYGSRQLGTCPVSAA